MFVISDSYNSRAVRNFVSDLNIMISTHKNGNFMYNSSIKLSIADLKTAGNSFVPNAITVIIFSSIAWFF